MDISLQTIRRFLCDLKYQASDNTTKIDYRTTEMRKITNQTLGTNDKLVMFRWIIECISLNDVYTAWAEGCMEESP